MSSAPLIGISASLHDFGDYGGVGVHRPVLLAGGLPMTLPQLPDAIAPALDAIDALLLAAWTRHRAPPLRPGAASAAGRDRAPARRLRARARRPRARPRPADSRQPAHHLPSVPATRSRSSPGARSSARSAHRGRGHSFHHQAIDRLGEGLAVVAASADGVAEAIELPGRPVLAVQWELQEEWRIDRRPFRVFEWFVQASESSRGGLLSSSSR